MTRKGQAARGSRPTRALSGRRTVLVVAAAATILVVSVAWAASRRGGSDAARQLEALTGQEDPGIAHVHGLGVDPADGTLYAATHYGLFRIPNGGTPVRVANRLQDTMGFTIAGPRQFLGSGHPDLREDLPSRLGLIESTDGGESWKQLSLAGKADFHALHSAHGKVYGYDSGGGFMVTVDKKTWETRSSLAMRDFAVSPSDAETIIATTESGLQRSNDGGRTFTALAGAPTLVVLGWDRSGELYGVAPTGDVYRSPDAGSTWEQISRLDGQPEAFVASEGRLLAATAGGIYESTDGARTWRLRFREQR
jgi:photosystem II stability/assembly factor-like uncharacterized protein